MVSSVPRRTVYAATLMAILALAGGWTLAAGSGAHTGPAQASSVVVTAPTDFRTAVVKDTQMLTVSQALILGLTGSAGKQATGPSPGNGLNSTGSTANALLAACPAIYCSANYSAVDMTNALTQADSALQVMLNVTQGLPATPSPAVGFDVQVEIIYTVASAPLTNVYAFGTGYFDSGVNSLASGVTTPGPTFYALALYVDLGTPATNLPSIADVVVTMNQCLVATVCP